MSHWMNRWNEIAPQARGLGLDAEQYTTANWNWSPEEGRQRVVRLERLIESRREIGRTEVPSDRNPGLMSVEQMWEEWNRLVPTARRLGCSRRVVSTPICWRASRQEATRRLTWIRLFVQNPARNLRAGPSTFLTPISVDTVSAIENRNAIRPQAIETTSLTPVVGPETFGVELEFMLPRGLGREALAQRLTDAGVPCQHEMYNHQIRGTWKLVTDGSLGDYELGTELVSPPLTEDGLEQVKVACRVLTEAGCRPTKKCGLHVHVGAQGRGAEFLKNLARAYRKWEPTIDGLMSPSRRAAVNPYCQPTYFSEVSLDRAQGVDEVMRACGHDVGLYSVRNAGRYKKLNLQSMYQHGTVEFRQHAGTVDGDKVAMWVRFCLKMVRASVRGPVDGSPTLPGLLSALGADEAESSYFNGRARRFGMAAELQMAA